MSSVTYLYLRWHSKFIFSFFSHIILRLICESIINNRVDLNEFFNFIFQSRPPNQPRPCSLRNLIRAPRLQTNSGLKNVRVRANFYIIRTELSGFRGNIKFIVSWCDTKMLSFFLIPLYRCMKVRLAREMLKVDTGVWLEQLDPSCQMIH